MTWNRDPSAPRTAAEVNLDAAPMGFKVTGDAAWDSDSADWAMFSDDGNQLVGLLVTTARQMCERESASVVATWIERQKAVIAEAGHPEVYDTMVRETIAYALDSAWLQAYGCPYAADA